MFSCIQKRQTEVEVYCSSILFCRIRSTFSHHLQALLDSQERLQYITHQRSGVRILVEAYFSSVMFLMNP